MRQILFFILILFSGLSLAQEPVISLDVQTRDDDTGKKLDGATVEVYQDGKLFVTKTSDSKGKVPLIDLPLNHNYTVIVKKDGYVSKVATIDGSYPNPEDLPPFIPFPMLTSLFEKVDGVDFAFLETTPMIKFNLDQWGNQTWDQAYTKQMLKKIEDLKKQMADKKKEEEEKKADFDAYVKAGDAAMGTQNYDVAISQYELALGLMQDPEVQGKLDNAKKLKAEKESAEQEEKAFSEKMAKAKEAYTAKNYQEALKLYQEAHDMRPNEQLPKTRIDEINDILAKQKAEEEQFNKFVKEGDAAMTSELYDDAITKYEAALGLRPGDPGVTAKLEEARKKKQEKADAEAKNKETEEKYKNLIAEADAAFDTEKYDLAKTKYEEALKVKPGEAHPTGRLKEIEDILRKKKEEEDAAKKLEEDYNKIISEANGMFDSKNWKGAKAKYEEALTLKKNEQYPIDRIELCNKEIEKESLNAEKDANYKAKMDEANAFFNQKKYEEAKAKYNEALGVKPGEKEPQDKINEIDDILQKQADQEKLEADYQAFMKEGNDLKNIKDYTAALDRYNKALNIKPGDADAKAKIDEINKLIAEDQKAKEDQEKFDNYIAKAEQAFNSKDYTTAKLNYQNALEIKDDEGAKARIKEIDELMAQQANQQETQEKYDAAIKEADQLYTANNYEAALEKYKEAKVIKPSEAYPQEKISELNEKIALQKEKEAKDKEFNELVAAADDYYAQKEYSKALQKYKEAIKIKPDPTISQKINELNGLIAEQEQNADTQKKYDLKIAEADAAFADRNWDIAKQLYKEADAMMPSQTYPDDQIAKIEEEMKKESQNEAEEQYQKIITKADNLLAGDQLDEAISYYERAKTIKPSDPYPQNQIDKINKMKADKANEQAEKERLEKEYNDLIKQADEAFNAKNWSAALSKYKEALIKKPGEPYPTGRIDEVNAELAKMDEQSQKDAEYNGYIAEADEKFNAGDYLESIAIYNKALGVKPNEAYPKNQIAKAEEMERQKSVNEIEEQYQKILEKAQEKLDNKDYQGALDLYIRAKTMKPSDPLPQQRIDEINQILADQQNSNNNQAEYDRILQQADYNFEKGEWEKARDFYQQAFDLINEKYPKDQIAKCEQNMKGESTSQIEMEYQKLISKADEYFDAKNYDKAKNLYQRAIKLKPSDAYPKNRLDEIDRLLHPENYVVDNGGLKDYGDPVNTTPLDIEGLLYEAEEQRRHRENEYVFEKEEEVEDFEKAWTNIEEDENFGTKKEVEGIQVDLETQEWSADMKREDANLEVEEMQEDLEYNVNDWGTSNENVVQYQNSYVTNLEIQIEERNDEDDLPREEYEADMERIQLEIRNENDYNANAQNNMNMEMKDNVEEIQIEHISNDPNNDTDRKNTEVNVEDFTVQVINKNNTDGWNQEDAVMDTKEGTELLVDERYAADVGNDIPRIDNVKKVDDLGKDQETVQRNQADDQYDATIDDKKYTESMIDEIQINNLNNDKPRQDTEILVEDTEIEIENSLVDNNLDQTSVVMNSDAQLDNFEIGIEDEFKDADKDREEYEETMEDVQMDIQGYNDNLSQENTDNSFDTKNYTEDMTDEKTKRDQEADMDAEKNIDGTNKAVDGMIAENQKIGDENRVEREGTEDYIETLKDIDLNAVDEKMKNKLGEDFPEGVTEEIYQVTDENGLLESFIIRRVVVKNGVGDVYEKVQTRYGTSSYTKNGESITEFQWSDETENAELTRN